MSNLKDAIRLLMMNRDSSLALKVEEMDKTYSEVYTLLINEIDNLKKSGAYIDKHGKLVFKISDSWIMTEDKGQLVLRHDGVEYHAFTYHSGINYEYPKRVLGISDEEQKLINN